jgi:hypothetical protein
MICAFVLGALTARSAGAQQSPEEIQQAKASAREFADRGSELFEAGRYAEALEAFREAERHYHAPTILLMVARCYDRLGRLLEAHAIYQRVVSEALPASAPEAFLKAQEMGKAELAALHRRIPTLQVLVIGVPVAGVTLSIDGRSIPANAEPIPKDPGRAVIVMARVPGRPPMERVVTLEEGRTERLTLDLSPSPAGARPLPAAPSDAPPRGSVLPAAIAFGAAGLGLGVGAVTGGMAAAQVDDIKSRCTSAGHCPRADQPKADRAQTLISVSTVGFVAGGLAAAAGVTLLVLRPGGGAPEAAKDAAVRVVVGPGSAQVAGRF